MRLSPFLLFSILSIQVFSQSKPLVVVDGFFTNKDSAFVVDYLEDEVKSLVSLTPDSARVFLGDFGNAGLVKIETYNRQSDKSIFFRNEENIFFTDPPKFFINDEYIIDLDLNSIDPHKIEKIEVIHPYNAVLSYGLEMKCGIVKITLKQ